MCEREQQIGEGQSRILGGGSRDETQGGGIWGYMMADKHDRGNTHPEGKNKWLFLFLQVCFFSSQI